MMFDEKVDAVNRVLEGYFAANRAKVQAQELMSLFVDAGIFPKDSERHGKPIRDVLRKLDSVNQLQRIPYVVPERKGGCTHWYFAPLTNAIQVENPVRKVVAESSVRFSRVSKGRSMSDEYYVIDLCDEVLGMTALRQHCFPFLKGDTGRMLPVDAYYEDLGLVVEYCESQHIRSTPFFDRKMTVSGVSRGEQRRIYDRRRAELLPQHGIRLVTIYYSCFGSTKRLRRDKDRDLEIVRTLLNGI